MSDWLVRREPAHPSGSAGHAGYRRCPSSQRRTVGILVEAKELAKRDTAQLVQCPGARKRPRPGRSRADSPGGWDTLGRVNSSWAASWPG